VLPLYGIAANATDVLIAADQLWDLRLSSKSGTHPTLLFHPLHEVIVQSSYFTFGESRMIVYMTTRWSDDVYTVYFYDIIGGTSTSISHPYSGGKVYYTVAEDSTLVVVDGDVVRIWSP
jgi:hypothetical protein